MRMVPGDHTASPAIASRSRLGLVIFFGMAFSLSWLLVGLIALVWGRNALPPAVTVSMFILGRCWRHLARVRMRKDGLACAGC
jgi:hypothetical protein